MFFYSHTTGFISMDKEKNRSDIENLDLNNPDDNLVSQFSDSITWGCGIFSIIIVYFAVSLIFFNRDMLIQILAFFEITNLAFFSSNLLKDYEITALVAILIAIITGLYVYLRFFSNINHNDFSNDMGNYLQFYETLYSTFFDVTILLILFLYLIFVKQSLLEFVIAFLVIVGLAISINMISNPHSKIIRDYSAIERMNSTLNKVSKKTGKELFADMESLSELIFFGLLRRNSVWITGALFLTIIVAMLGIAGAYNVLTIIILELMIIRYALFQSQVGSLPKIPVNLYLENCEIMNRVFMIREGRDILLVLTQYDTFMLIMKSHLKKVEPIIESITSE